MKQRVLMSALLLGCLILGGISVVIYAGQDRKAPVIYVKKEDVTYHERDSYKELLSGVTAKDNRDGDVTEDIFIDKIVPADDGKAVVYYGVMDKAKNVGTATRTVNYNTSGAGIQTAATDVQADAEAENQAEEAKKAEEIKQADQENAKAEDPNELVPTTEAPVIALTTDHVTVAAGSEFDPMSVVKGVADTVDNADVLSRQISAEGAYDMNTPGTYQLQYFVIDSDGNTSDIKTLTITVQ